jgi:hypothetical protein
MQWRESFRAEVSQALRQLGLKACPVCGLADSVGIGRWPVLLVDGGLPLRTNDHPLGEDRDDELTFAVRIECAACGYLMLFNALRFRTENEKIIVLERSEGDQLGE